MPRATFPGTACLAALGAAAAFAAVAAVAAGGVPVPLDRELALRIRALDLPALGLLLAAFTLAGSTPATFLAAFATAAWAHRRGDRRAAGVLAAVAILAKVLSASLKWLYARPRPVLFPAVADAYGYSFPSGHALSAVAIFGTIAVVAVRLRPGWRRHAAVLAPVVALLVGLSRIYLGLHWPSDVLGGYAAGAFLLLSGICALGAGRGRDGPR